MKEVTAVRDQETYERLRACYKSGYSDRWRESLTIFLDYLLEEDSRWCQVPDHRHFDGQKHLARRLGLVRERLLRLNLGGTTAHAQRPKTGFAARR